MKPFPSLRKKIEAFEEEKKDENSLFNPNAIKFTKKDAPTKRSKERFQKRSKQERLEMSHFILPKKKRPAFLWSPLTATNTTVITTMATNNRIGITSPVTTTSCKTCKKWGAPCPFCVQSAPHLLP